MNSSRDPFPVRHNEDNDHWIVTVEGKDIPCHSRDDAESISRLPNLNAEALDEDLVCADTSTKLAFLKKAKQMLALQSTYGFRCLASRDVERAVMRIKETLDK